MKPYTIDVPVLLIFWARPEQFSQVFEQVKQARPSKLFLYQDGPREKMPGDVEGIEACREIAANIDWECDVLRFFQEENIGCDPSEFIAQKWAFSHVDRCIVLEDDDVPSQSFFPFCKEMLEKYHDDERINIISGMNHLGIHDDCPNDYLFTRTVSIWGWASWRRVIDQWEEDLKFLDDPYSTKLIGEVLGKKRMKTVRRHRESGRAYYESILETSCFLNSRLNIVPQRNMISNIGISALSVHGATSLKRMPKGIRRVFNMKTHEIEFPLNHPEYVVDDVLYHKKRNRIMADGHPWISLYRRFESLFRRKILGFKVGS